MLVLTRRMGESICVGDGIVITVFDTNGSRTRFGIEAPVRVTVDREEVRHRKGAQHTNLLLADRIRSRSRRKMNQKEEPYAIA